jgi:hypothetical protein
MIAVPPDFRFFDSELTALWISKKDEEYVLRLT